MGARVVTATDDKLPNMYEEAWYGGDGPGQGATTANMFFYSNAAIVVPDFLKQHVILKF